MYSRMYFTFSSEKQYTAMWQVLWLSPSSERTRPHIETSERKLRDVGGGGGLTSSKSFVTIGVHKDHIPALA